MTDNATPPIKAYIPLGNAIHYKNAIAHGESTLVTHAGNQLLHTGSDSVGITCANGNQLQIDQNTYKTLISDMVSALPKHGNALIVPNGFNLKTWHDPQVAYSIRDEIDGAARPVAALSRAIDTPCIESPASTPRVTGNQATRKK